MNKAEHENYCRDECRCGATIAPSIETARIYIATIPEELPLLFVFPKSRDEEIRACKNPRVRKEKYCAWKLLEYALLQVGLSMSDLCFSKTEHGKWTTNACYFSLTHCGEFVAVALSKTPIGVDAERLTEKLTSARRKFLTKQELSFYEALPQKEQLDYLAKKWTQKESIFKAYGEGAFVPSRIRTDDYPTQTYVMKDGYILSVATDAAKIVLRDLRQARE